MLVSAQERDFFQMKTKKLSEKAMVISGTQYNTNQLLLQSKNGLILIDSGISPEYAEKLKDIAAKEFNTTQFLYVISCR